MSRIELHIYTSQIRRDVHALEAHQYTQHARYWGRFRASCWILTCRSRDDQHGTECWGVHENHMIARTPYHIRYDFTLSAHTSENLSHGHIGIRDARRYITG